MSGDSDTSPCSSADTDENCRRSTALFGPVMLCNDGGFFGYNSSTAACDAWRAEPAYSARVESCIMLSLNLVLTLVFREVWRVHMQDEERATLIRREEERQRQTSRRNRSTLRRVLSKRSTSKWTLTRSGSSNWTPAEASFSSVAQEAPESEAAHGANRELGSSDGSPKASRLSKRVDNAEGPSAIELSGDTLAIAHSEKPLGQRRETRQQRRWSQNCRPQVDPLAKGAHLSPPPLPSAVSEPETDVQEDVPPPRKVVNLGELQPSDSHTAPSVSLQLSECSQLGAESSISSPRRSCFGSFRGSRSSRCSISSRSGCEPSSSSKRLRSSADGGMSPRGLMITGAETLTSAVSGAVTGTASVVTGGAEALTSAVSSAVTGTASAVTSAVTGTASVVSGGAEAIARDLVHQVRALQHQVENLSNLPSGLLQAPASIRRNLKSSDSPLRRRLRSFAYASCLGAVTCCAVWLATLFFMTSAAHGMLNNSYLLEWGWVGSRAGVFSKLMIINVAFWVASMVIVSVDWMRNVRNARIQRREQRRESLSPEERDMLTWVPGDNVNESVSLLAYMEETWEKLCAQGYTAHTRWPVYRTQVSAQRLVFCRDEGSLQASGC